MKTAWGRLVIGCTGRLWLETLNTWVQLGTTSQDSWLQPPYWIEITYPATTQVKPFSSSIYPLPSGPWFLLNFWSYLRKEKIDCSLITIPIKASSVSSIPILSDLEIYTFFKINLDRQDIGFSSAQLAESQTCLCQIVKLTKEFDGS